MTHSASNDADAGQNVRPFTPPLGTGDTQHYDRAIRRWTREMRWRTAMLKSLVPRPGETIVDMGCGTGSFAILLKQQCPGVSVIGLDPDAEALALARDKAHQAGVEIEWRQGFADSLEESAADAVTSSLVFHQIPLPGKVSGIADMFAALKPEGRLVLADYGLQTGLMRWLFRVTVQRLDGVADTQPNADGVLPDLVARAGFANIVERYRVDTLTGTIAILTARKP